jgi:hypothetical protein
LGSLVRQPSLSNNLQRFDPLAQAIEIPFLDPLRKVLESLGRMSKAAAGGKLNARGIDILDG